MSIISKVRGWLDMVLNRRAKEAFGVESVTTDEMQSFIDRCVKIYRGKPDWLDDEGHIKTVNFAASVCSEIARLATMNIQITITGGPRADYLQEQINDVIDGLRWDVEKACAAGMMILKPYEGGVEMLLPDRFRIVDTRGGDITGVVFIDRRHEEDSGRWFTRLEYHQIHTDGRYTVQNRYFMGSSERDDGRPVPMETTPWVTEALADDVTVEGADGFLFGIFRTPKANNIDLESPIGLPMFSNAIEELRDLDIAYSRNAKEIKDSKRMVLLDSDRLFPFGGQTGGNAINKAALVREAGLPDFIKAVEGSGSVEKEVYHEINPTLNTKTRLDGINALLSQIGFKCGFSNGYFVFNEKTGMVTATQVESDDRRTLQLVADVRKALRDCMDGFIYALDRFADAYGVTARGAYEVAYDFADLTMNEEEDKARWWGYVLQNKVPFWYYLMRFEGMTEEDAKALEAEAAPTGGGLFPAEE